MAVLLQTPLTGQGPGYTCALLAREMATEGLMVTIVAPRLRGFPVSPAEVIEVLPRWTRYIPYRCLRSMAQARLETAFLTFAIGSKTAAAYIFPDAKLETIIQLKRAGVTVFREMINCHRGTAKIILDNAYHRLGLAPQHGITEEFVILEQKALEAVDYIFCPNPMVEISLLENGVPASKLLKASYGWEPARLAGSERLLRPGDGITAVFVGSICVRKGAHLLLDYWAQSGVKGRLVMAGQLEPTIRLKCADHLCRDDVIVFDHIQNVGELYRSADIFVFPSLEEGGPQVTYEACGCGLPAVTSPMGAGRIVRHDKEGFVIEPYDKAAWISAFRTLANNISLRRNMANSAAERARSFVWNEVAGRRRRQVLDILSNHRNPSDIPA